MLTLFCSSYNRIRCNKLLKLNKNSTFDEIKSWSEGAYLILNGINAIPNGIINLELMNQSQINELCNKIKNLIENGDWNFNVEGFLKDPYNGLKQDEVYGGNEWFTSLFNTSLNVTLPIVGASAWLIGHIGEFILNLFKTNNGYTFWENINDHGMNDYWYNFREKSRYFSERLRMVSKDFHDPIRIYVTDHGVHEPVIQIYNIGSEKDRRPDYYCGGGTCGDKNNLD